MSPQHHLHSVYLDAEKCKGCTNCLKRCPTEAIRVRGGHAVITAEQCIDCGECIRICPYQAKKALYDSMEALAGYKWKIALPAPALYGQFNNLSDVDYVLTGLLACGFDDVFEVARAAEIVTEYTRNYIRNANPKKPIISSACPAVTRLISIRYPNLCENLLPLLPPVELAARLAKKEALAAHPELTEADIGVAFLSPCPAKVSYARNPIGVSGTAIDAVLSISEIYFSLVEKMKDIETPEPLSRCGIIGIGWAGAGGEATSLFNDKYLAADGIENVIKVLDQIDNNNFSDIAFVELGACPGGCVGGVLTVENPYIAKARLQALRRYLPVSQNRVDGEHVPHDACWETAVEYRPVARLADDRMRAMQIMAQIQEVYSRLPHLDCASCGAPSCMAEAEDIVRGQSEETDCIFKLRELYLAAKQEEVPPDDDE